VLAMSFRSGTAEVWFSVLIPLSGLMSKPRMISLAVLSSTSSPLLLPLCCLPFEIIRAAVGNGVGSYLLSYFIPAAYLFFCF